MSLFRVSLLCFLTALAPGFGAEEIRRIAILSASDLEEPAALLTAAFSTAAGIELVERDQLAAAVRERNLQAGNLASNQIAALGKVLGAQAILALSRPAPGPAFSCRLIAVDSGLTIGETSAAWPMQDPAGWASLLARQYAGAMRRIPQSPGTTALVVNLGVRSPTAGPDAQKLERTSAFAIGRSLTEIAGVFVLDRTQMREANWERQLSESSQPNFWSGTWLLDGNIQDTGSKLVYEGQLRSLGQGGGHPIKAEAASPEEIGKAVAAAIAKILGAQPSVAVSDVRAESQFFQEQAEWAFRWKLYDEAERAADASWFLGNTTEALGLIRALSAARTVERQLGTMGGTFPNSVSYAEGLEGLVRAFSNLLETVRHAGQEPSPKFLADATEVFAIASKLLKQRYFKNLPASAEEETSSKIVRSQLRLLAPMLAEECQRAWTKLPPAQQKAARYPSKPPVSFFADYLIYSPLWGDTPEQSAEEFEKALAASDDLDPEVGRGVRRMAILDRENHAPVMPIVVAWNVADRPRVSEVRNQLLEKLMLGRPERKLEACHLALQRYYNFQDEKLLAKVPDEVILKQVRKAYEILNDLSPQITAGQVDHGAVSEVIILAGQLIEIYKRPSLAAEVADLQKKLLLRLLQAGWPGPPEVYNPLFRDVSFTDAEREQYVAAIKAIPAAGVKKWFPAHFVESVVKQTNVGPSFRPTPPPLAPVDNALPVAYRFPIAEGTERALVEDVIPFKGRFLVRVNDYSHSLKIFELDPQTGGQKVLFDVSGRDPIYVALNAAKAWTADEHFLYFIGNRTIYRIELSSGKLNAREIALLSPSDAVIRLISGQLYVFQSGVVLRIDPGSFEAELLASAKRRPAQTILDDQIDLDLTPIELDGNMALVSRDKIYRWNASTRNFDSTPVELSPRSRKPYDRAFVLRLLAQLEISRSSPSGDLGYWLVVDPNRTGIAPSIKGYWPPTVIGGRQANSVMGMSPGGSVLYLLFWIREQGMLLMAYGPSGNHCAPLGGLDTTKYREVTGSEDGVLVWGGGAKELLFYRFKDMEKYPP